MPRYIEVENDNDSERSEDVAVPVACSAPQDNSSSSCSIYGSMHDAMTAQDESQLSPEEVPSIAKASDCGEKSQTFENHSFFGSIYSAMTPEEPQSETQGSTSGRPSNVESSDQGKTSMYSSQNSMVASQKSQAASVDLSLFKDLPSISEASDRKQDKQDYGCCGDVDDTPTVNTRRRVTGEFWGQKLTDDLSEDTQSLQTSRISNTSR